MGNCQAAEAATVVIQHPGNKIERIYWSVSANEIMGSNPGHYVALVVTSLTMKNENGTPVKQLKLLKPDDTLLIGQVYRLVSFEDVLKEFAAKKCVKLGKLLKENGGLGLGMELKKKKRDLPRTKLGSESGNCSGVKVEQEVNRVGTSGGGGGGGSRYIGRHHGGGGQWRPALQSIAEIGI
ncbi:hypothetical protein E1A91_D03G031200v1 [Gossypium mustelinum]|uniref:DUF4228 domain-containing protein n=4 Tax=Gossypium TaxID=3633 RepID=A0A5J5RZT6_GOSBA|nr:hypothetical protein ES319_D03G030600v1 [Gossypium barbadense]TYG75473.1 hypothetical protein ES288_D03G034000v1 [Gossypium darwinii]TYH79032.1 hypothetical protein ES332_D03G033300v1 [Gossypium tomentosum]TYI89108.1 hypothetical protein E1A91_D03G031200v1 [Gossypium mustelinum]